MRDAPRLRIERSLAARLALAALFLPACIQVPVEVEVHTDTNVVERLAAVETYALTPPPSPNPVLGPRVEAEIHAALADRGMRETSTENAEIAVAYRAAEKPGERIRTVADPDVSAYDVREAYFGNTVEIDVSDAKTGERLWRGVGRVGVVDAGSLPAAAAKATREILEEFPRP